MNKNLRLFWRGVKASWSMHLIEITPGIYLGMRLPRMLLQSLFFVLIAAAAGGASFARFALIGNAVQIAVFYVVLFMEDIFETEKWNNTLQYLLASPANWLPLMIGRSASYFGDALVSTTITFVVLIPLLNIQISLLNLLRSIPLILITIASASTLGWILGAISLPIRSGNTISNIVGYSMMVLCGINFPFTLLPSYLQVVGNILPVTHGLLAIRAVVDGASYSSVLMLMGQEILIAIVYGTMAWLVFGYHLRVTRQKGTFELV